MYIPAAAVCRPAVAGNLAAAGCSTEAAEQWAASVAESAAHRAGSAARQVESVVEWRENQAGSAVHAAENSSGGPGHRVAAWAESAFPPAGWARLEFLGQRVPRRQFVAAPAFLTDSFVGRSSIRLQALEIPTI